MDIDVVVPGHGEVCDTKMVRKFRLFIQECVNIVKEAIKRGIFIREKMVVWRCTPAQGCNAEMSYASTKYYQGGEKVHEHLVWVARKGEKRTLTAALDLQYPGRGPSYLDSSRLSRPD
jgi:hypothetical protein